MDRVMKAARSTGSLNLSNRSLSEVPGEVYRNLDAVGDGEKWWEAVELQKLILAHNNIEVLKEDLRNLSMLSVLNISHNKISILPASIGELTVLKLLDVSFNSIICIPEEIGSATSLVKFDCSNNQLKELPSSLGRCVDLSELKASNNCISRLPGDLANCSKLIKLDIEGNKLSVLPESMLLLWNMLTELNAARNLLSCIPDNIGKLSRLIRLDFHQNRISSIPLSIKDCYSLMEFFMGNNILSSLPAELGFLPVLGTLDLHSNQLKEFPVEACKLHLSVLDLSNNSLSGLPPEIGTMTTLRKLVLNGNPIRTIRSSLVSGPTTALLKYLRSRLSTDEMSGSASTTLKDDHLAMAARLSISSKEISLGGFGLSSIPPVVWESSHIVKVDLSRNSIELLPNELSLCFSLQTLILSGNKIKEWPQLVFASLSNLLCLKLDNNPLAKGPLKKIVHLCNSTGFIFVRRWFIRLTRERRRRRKKETKRIRRRRERGRGSLLPAAVLRTSTNDGDGATLLGDGLRRWTIPSEGFEVLSKLQVLDLSSNAACLPDTPALSKLRELQELYLRHMQLSEVPSDIPNLQQLCILDLSLNSLVSIPKDFKNLVCLNELDLSDNNIVALPPELGLLESTLQVLRLNGNPLRSIRRSILDRGANAVLKYLKDKIPE